MKPFLCSCGANSPELFYKTQKSQCKKCASYAGAQRYHNMSDAERQVYRDKVVARRNGDRMMQYRLHSAKARSVKNNLEFSISHAYVEELWQRQGGLCYYTGVQMSKDQSNNRESVSLERLNSAIGYTPENVVLCCSAVNIMKNDLGLSEFKEWITLLHNNISNF